MKVKSGSRREFLRSEHIIFLISAIMNKLFTYLLPFAALCGAVAILSNRPEAASSESELPKATPNTFKVSVPSIVDRNLTDNLSADSLVQNTQVPDLRALAA